MIRSMTAYAASAIDSPRGTLSWELRSVNHRYLDVSLRLPEDFRPLESDIRQKFKAALDRGKVEAHQELDGLCGGGAQPDLVRLLSWPGLVVTERPDMEEERRRALELLDSA